MSEGARRASVVALGMFDGMHIGHRRVIGRAVEVARAHGWQCVVYTFENHPRAVFGEAPAPLMTSGERRRAMLRMGVDAVDMVRFDRAMAELSPNAFLAALLAAYDVRAVVAGSDFTFGFKGAGTVDTLRREGAALGFSVYEVPFVMLGGEKVSSTRIRDALERGDVALAHEMLGDSAG